MPDIRSGKMKRIKALDSRLRAGVSIFTRSPGFRSNPLSGRRICRSAVPINRHMDTDWQDEQPPEAVIRISANPS